MVGDTDGYNDQGQAPHAYLYPYNMPYYVDPRMMASQQLLNPPTHGPAPCGYAPHAYFGAPVYAFPPHIYGYPLPALHPNYMPHSYHYPVPQMMHGAHPLVPTHPPYYQPAPVGKFDGEPVEDNYELDDFQGDGADERYDDYDEDAEPNTDCDGNSVELACSPYESKEQQQEQEQEDEKNDDICAAVTQLQLSNTSSPCATTEQGRSPRSGAVSPLSAREHSGVMYYGVAPQVPVTQYRIVSRKAGYSHTIDADKLPHLALNGYPGASPRHTPTFGPMMDHPSSLTPVMRPRVGSRATKERQWCPKDTNCASYACALLHSEGRIPQCAEGHNCVEYKCPLLHPGMLKVGPYNVTLVYCTCAFNTVSTTSKSKNGNKKEGCVCPRICRRAYHLSPLKALIENAVYTFFDNDASFKARVELKHMTPEGGKDGILLGWKHMSQYQLGLREGSVVKVLLLSKPIRCT